MFQTKKAFTLAELTIVVTLLSILSVFGFIYVSNNIQDTRDVVRLADLDNIEKSLEIYAIQQGNYPPPDNFIAITYSGSTVWNQGTFGDNAYRAVGRLSHKPVDPLSGTEYSYSVLSNGTEYEISTAFEGDNISWFPGVSQTYADNKRAYLIGNYNKKFVSINNASTNTILALPSITASNTYTPEVETILQNNDLVIHGDENLPANYNHIYTQNGNVDIGIDDIIVYHGNMSDLSSIDGKRAFLQSLQDKYANNPSLDTIDTAYQTLIKLDLSDNQQVENYMMILITKGVGGINIQ